MPASTLIILNEAPAGGRWIPPGGLIFGNLAHGASWLLLAGVALHGPAPSWLDFGWLHLVALGWITMVALSVLIHVIPAFTDAVWRCERTARNSLWVYAAGVLVLVAGFCLGIAAALPWGGALIVLGLIGYLVPAAWTLLGAWRIGKTEAAVARALGITLLFLLLTAILGAVFTLVLDARLPALFLKAAPVHAELGLFGWLTILLMGVSVKTIGPIAGSRSNVKWRHIASAGGVFAGTLLLAAGSMLAASTLLWTGLAAAACGALLYAFDMSVILLRARVPHRPPQAFVAAALVWFIVGVALCACVLAGLPWARACVFVILIGWVGQMINAHMHHIGVRLLITMFRGDDDETRPGTVLHAPLSWAAFALFQIAVAAAAGALLCGLPMLLLFAAIAGFLAWCATVGNAIAAVRQLRIGQTAH